MASKIVNIINVPSDVGSVYAGKSRAPAAIKSAGLHEQLRAAGFKVAESSALSEGACGWVSSTRDPNGGRNEANVVEACRQVQSTVLTDLKNGTNAFQLILAGECLFCPSIMSAYWKACEGTGKRVGIIYVDADCDLYYPKDSGSGNIAGMTLTHLTLRDGALESMRQFSKPDGSGVVDGNNIVLFGLNIDSPANKREHLGYLFDNRYRVVTSKAVQEAPKSQAIAALKWIEERVDHIIVHLDVDVIDPGRYPLGNVPSYTGLGFEETMAAVKTFLASEKAVGLSLAEVNPDHDPGLMMTGQLVAQIVDALKAKAKS